MRIFGVTFSFGCLTQNRKRAKLVPADARIHHERRCTGAVRCVGSNSEQNIGRTGRNGSTQKIPYKRILEI